MSSAVEQMTAEARRARAQDLLERLAGSDASLRADQATAIEALAGEGRRLLVVQRTGWGKSAVYFIATALLREAGAGPTLLISPLLALMRDQVAAAERAGVRATTINSTNTDAWSQIESALDADAIDLLLISPERLNNPGFRDRVLPDLIRRVGMVVIDEAHCVSDWGHDFRPDYRRIAAVLRGLGDIPVLATTATANDRVVADIVEQLGVDPLTLRGQLDRVSLRLATVATADDAERLAWLASWIPTTAGSGIIYCLTVADTETVASFLREQGIVAQAYSAALPSDERERLEEDLRANRITALVATTALGMGFDKPDLAFVVHHGLPSSPIAYYQAIGRAGRGIDRADVVALPGRADERIWAHFASTALPSRSFADELVEVLAANGPLSVPRLERHVNAGRSRIEAALKVLDVDGAVERTSDGWTAGGAQWQPDAERLARVREARDVEADAMRTYTTLQAEGRCLMGFLLSHLDDPSAAREEGWRCGRCGGCAPQEVGAVEHTADAELIARAGRHLRGRTVPLPPRKMWPSGLQGRRGRIGVDASAATGRALAQGEDPGWGEVVDVLLREGADPDDPAVAAALDEAITGFTTVLRDWDWASRPAWITTVPSRRRGPVITRIAGRIGALGRMPVHDVLRRVEPDRPPQASRSNSLHQAANVVDAFVVEPSALAAAPAGPVLLIDDTTGSGWTLTVCAALLREAGVPAVLPLVLRRDR